MRLTIFFACMLVSVQSFAAKFDFKVDANGVSCAIQTVDASQFQAKWGLNPNRNLVSEIYILNDPKIENVYASFASWTGHLIDLVPVSPSKGKLTGPLLGLAPNFAVLHFLNGEGEGFAVMVRTKMDPAQYGASMRSNKFNGINPICVLKYSDLAELAVTNPRAVKKVRCSGPQKVQQPVGKALEMDCEELN
jgi:hypothetical protein